MAPNRAVGLDSVYNKDFYLTDAALETSSFRNDQWKGLRRLVDPSD